jgi:hypothetical protein
MEKSLAINPDGRYEALSEWLQDLKRPNPNWLNSRSQPLLEKDPLLFWKITAICGWLLVILLSYFLLS